MIKRELLANTRLEKRALDERVHKLSEVVDMSATQRRSLGYSDEHTDLVFKQFAIMSAYQTLLAQRIELMNAEKYREEVKSEQS